jgi:heme/copper-type cytochrome/quinol oxidase subunit 4
MNIHMNERKGKSGSKLVLATLIAGTVIVVTVVAALWAETNENIQFGYSPFGPRAPPFPATVPGDYEFFYTIQTVFSTINVTLSIFLLLMYLNIYRKTRSEFTVGLIIFSGVLILNAVVSIPLVHRAFGFYDFGLGPFAMLPTLFTCLALVVLLYLTLEY